jgi:hypothetical protein
VASATPFALRLAQIPKNYLVGFSNPAELPVTIAAAALVAISIWLLVSRAQPRERRGAAIAGSFTACFLAAPLVLALAGSDYLATRNVVAGVVPATVAVAAGFASSRHGMLAATLLCALWLGIVVSVATDEASQRPDWRGAASALGQPKVPRALVVTPWIDSEVWVYLPAACPMPSQGAPVREISIVEMARLGRYGLGRPRPPRPEGQPRALPGFVLAEMRETPTYTLISFRSTEPRRVSPGALRPLALEAGAEPAALLQAPAMSEGAKMHCD